MIKRLAQKIILNLTRRDFTYDKLRKVLLWSLGIFIFLYVVIGLSWHFGFNNPTVSISVKINHFTWWILIFLQNTTTLTILFLKKVKFMMLKKYQPFIQMEVAGKIEIYS